MNISIEKWQKHIKTVHHYVHEFAAVTHGVCPGLFSADSAAYSPWKSCDKSLHSVLYSVT